MTSVRLFFDLLRAKFLTRNAQPFEEADAIILELQATGSVRNGMSEVRLLLQVMPHNGRNYVAECHQVFLQGHLPNLRAGMRTKILIYPNDPSKIQWVPNSQR